LKGQLLRLAKGTAIYGIGGLFTRVISFFLLPLFTSYLTPADYGISSLLTMMSFVLAPVFSLGFGTSIGICYFDNARGEGKCGTIWTSFVLLLLSSLALTALGTAFSGEVSVLLFQTGRYGYFVVLSILSTCAGVMALPFMLRLQFEERASLFVVLGTLSALASALVSVYMVVFLNGGIKGFIEAQLIGQAVTLLLFASTSLGLNFRFSRDIGWGLLKYGLPMVPSFASLFVLQQSNRYILQYFKGIESVGLYTVGYSIGMVMNLLVQAFTNAWTPYFLSFADKQEEARRNFGKVATYYTFGLGTMSLMFYVFAKPLILMMTKPPFHDAYAVVGLAATASFLTGMFSLFLPGVYFAREVKFVSVVQGVSATGALMINIALIQLLGIVGAGVSLVLGTLLMILLMYAWNRRRRKTYIDIPFEWDRILVYALAYAGCAGLMSMKRNFTVTQELLLSSAVSVVLLLGVYSLLREKERKALGKYLGLAGEES
jgi:O-antigen/teichoic acid export membrane protein